MEMNDRRGITLVELLVSIAILALVMSVSVSAFGRFTGERTLGTESSRVSALLGEARSRALSSIGGSQYGVQFDSDRAVLFEGTTYDDDAEDNKEVLFNARVTISDISLEGGGDDVVFERISGRTSQYGSITLVLSGSAGTADITIEESGVAYVE